VPEQLEKVVRGSDQVPFTVDLLQSPQQELTQATPLLDLAVHRLHDRLALCVDRRVRRQRKLVRRFASLIVTSNWCRDRIARFLCLRILSG